ncbi:MAG: DNA polymerase [Microbacteriaceae bacterium]
MAFSGLDLRYHDGLYEATRSRIAGVALASSIDDSSYLALQHDTDNADIAPSEVFDTFRQLGEDIRSGKITALFWNAGFDQTMLAKLLGITAWRPEWFVDGMLLDKFLRPRSRRHDLKSTVAATLKINMPEFSAPMVDAEVPVIDDHPLIKPRPTRAKDFGARTPEDSHAYAESDVRETLRYIVAVAARTDLDRYQEICRLEHAFVTPVRALHETCIGYDRQALKVLADKVLEARELCRSILGDTGLKNPASNPQALIWLRGLGFNGESTGKTQLASVQGDKLRLAARLLSEFRRTNVYVNSYLSIAINADHPTELYGSWRGWGAKSGRMSAGPARDRRTGETHVFASWLPQGQPKSNDFRNLYCARPGYQIITADWRAMEYRVAAVLADAPSWIATFNDPDPEAQDVHAASARGIFTGFDAAAEVQQNAWRDVGKTVNFAVLFGAAADLVSGMLGVPVDRAQEIIDRFYRSEPALLAWKNKVQDEAQRLGIVHTYFGRPIAVTGKEMTDGSEDEPPVHAACNYVIQGSCADILRVAVTRFFELEASNIKIMGGDDSVRLINLIHDEVVLEVLTSKVEQVSLVLRECMETAAPSEWPVKLLADLKHGPAWQK